MTLEAPLEAVRRHWSPTGVAIWPFISAPWEVAVVLW